MFLVLLQPLSPIIVRVEGETPKDIGVIDIIFGSLGITGILLVGAAVLGIALGGIMIWFRNRSASAGIAPSSAYGFTPSSRDLSTTDESLKE